MKKVISLVVVIVFVIMLFNFESYEIGDFYGAKNAGADSLIRKTYYELDYNNAGFSYTTEYVPFSDNTDLPFYYLPEILLSTDDYIFLIRFTGNSSGESFARYASSYAFNNMVYIPIDIDYISVDIFVRSDTLTIYEVASGKSYDISEGLDGLTGDHGFGLKTIIQYGVNVSQDSSDGWLNRYSAEAYDYFTSELKLEFLYNGDYPFPPIGTASTAISANFYRAYDLVDTSASDGAFWLTNIVNDFEDLGSFPSLPQREKYDTVLDYIGGYYQWVVSAIMYLFDLVSLVLGGIF